MALRFASLTLDELTQLKTALFTYMTSGTISAGLAEYEITGRKVKKLSLKEVAEILNEIANEIARRSLGHDLFGADMILGEFGGPS